VIARLAPYILANDVVGVGKELQVRLGTPSQYITPFLDLLLTLLWKRIIV
jgi:hypothetical protein